VVRDGANTLQADALRILVALDRRELNSDHAAVEPHGTHRHALVKVFRTIMAEKKITEFVFIGNARGVESTCLEGSVV